MSHPLGRVFAGCNAGLPGSKQLDMASKLLALKGAGAAEAPRRLGDISWASGHVSFGLASMVGPRLLLSTRLDVLAGIERNLKRALPAGSGFVDLGSCGPRARDAALVASTCARRTGQSLVACMGRRKGGTSVEPPGVTVRWMEGLSA